jgi:hypothetical protein
MEGTVHILDLAQTLPHDQAYYDNHAKSDGTTVLRDMLDDMGKDA